MATSRSPLTAPPTRSASITIPTPESPGTSPSSPHRHHDRHHGRRRPTATSRSIGGTAHLTSYTNPTRANPSSISPPSPLRDLNRHATHRRAIGSLRSPRTARSGSSRTDDPVSGDAVFTTPPPSPRRDHNRHRTHPAQLPTSGSRPNGTAYHTTSTYNGLHRSNTTYVTTITTTGTLTTVIPLAGAPGGLQFAPDGTAYQTTTPKTRHRRHHHQRHHHHNRRQRDSDLTLRLPVQRPPIAPDSTAYQSIHTYDATTDVYNTYVTAITTDGTTRISLLTPSRPPPDLPRTAPSTRPPTPTTPSRATPRGVIAITGTAVDLG